MTLTGPGGIGKTRLALAGRRAAARRLPDGALFVDLAPISDPALVLPAIATTLGVRERADQPPLDHPGRLAAGQAAAAGAGQLRAGARAPRRRRRAAARLPALSRCWSTSRARRCGSRGEHEFPVAAAAAAATRPMPPRRSLAEYSDAVRLFVDARQRRPARLRADRDERAGRRGDLPAARRAAAGDRAGRRPRAAASRRAALLARLEQRLPLLDRRPARRAGAAATLRDDDRLELRPAHAGGAGALPAA